ncbi:hypothetical protein OG394_24030 [Kribbella sp. NBC_01245]|uniref:hypothetical protein n=1 Tax=Kribbella sp. NBC_01245 TaxID=2903578 RepID=UPI002E2DCDD2|nr:hypothetical protein [Kribbella sp. NBC_01245]
MASFDPKKWLLNSDGAGDQVVKAPAFSLTKVLTIATPLLTIVVGLVGDYMKDKEINWAPSHIVSLALGVLALVAIISAADLIARGVATAATVTADGAARQPASLSTFATPLKASRISVNPNVDVKIAAISSEHPPRFLCVDKKGNATWESETDLNFTPDA